MTPGLGDLSTAELRAELKTEIAKVADAKSKPLDTATMLGLVVAFVRRFIVFADDAQLVAVALWVAHTHALDASQCTPYLSVESAQKRSGKSRLLEVLAALARESMHVANISEAALFRMLATEPTLLIDEVDALFASGAERTEALRNVLNAGNRRGVHVIRCVGPNHTPTPFVVFGAKVLAGIDTGRLPDTIRDRSITLRMKRKVGAEHVERLLWPKVRPAADALRERIAQWGAENVDRLADVEPDLPLELDDRAAEAWWALLAIADAAGGSWPTDARAAAVSLHEAGAAEDEAIGVQLLADLRALFGDALAMHTRDVVSALNGLEESGWGSWHDGNGMRPRDLSKRLRPFGVRSKKVNVSGESLQGYHRDDLEDAWVRYLPAGVSEHPEPMEPPASQAGSEVPFPFEVPEPANQTEPETPHSNGKVPEVPDIPDGGPDGLDPAAELERLRAKYPEIGGAA